MSQQDLMMCPDGDVFTKKEVYAIWIKERKRFFKKEYIVYLMFKGDDSPEWVWNTKTLEEARKIRDALIADLVPDLVKKS